jgi:hypothetical protein
VLVPDRATQACSRVYWTVSAVPAVAGGVYFLDESSYLIVVAGLLVFSLLLGWLGYVIYDWRGETS